MNYLHAMKRTLTLLPALLLLVAAVPASAQLWRDDPGLNPIPNLNGPWYANGDPERPCESGSGPGGGRHPPGGGQGRMLARHRASRPAATAQPASPWSPSFAPLRPAYAPPRWRWASSPSATP